jgi:hypothetical protein
MQIPAFLLFDSAPSRRVASFMTGLLKRRKLLARLSRKIILRGWDDIVQKQWRPATLFAATRKPKISQKTVALGIAVGIFHARS